jgi:hypothetical protein
VVAALDTVIKWVAKLPPASPAPRLALPSLELKILPQLQGLRQGTKQRQAQVDTSDAVEAQIQGEIGVSQSQIELAIGRKKRVKASTRK